MLEGIHFCSLFYIFYAGIFSIYRIWKKLTIPNIITLFLIVILFFFWVPVLLDVFIGIPSYDKKFNQFNVVANDLVTCIIYNFYIGSILFLYSSYILKKELMISTLDIKNILNISKRKKIVLYYFSFLPLFLFLLLDNPIQYVIFKWIDSELVIDDPLAVYVYRFTLLAALTASILLVINIENKKRIEILCSLLLLLCVIGLNGKRFIVPLILIVCIGLYYFQGIKKKYRFLFQILFLLLLFGIFIKSYGKNITDSFDDTYTKLRIDFGRDDVTKYTIYTTFVKGESILEYPMQSFLFNLFFWIPREWWENKPQPYAVYLTSSLLELKEIRYLNWSMTTSILEETIANMNFMGFFFPYWFILVLKKINKLPVYSRLVGILFCLMMFVVQFSAMHILFILFIILYLSKK